MSRRSRFKATAPYQRSNQCQMYSSKLWGRLSGLPWSMHEHGSFEALVTPKSCDDFSLHIRHPAARSNHAFRISCSNLKMPPCPTVFSPIPDQKARQA